MLNLYTDSDFQLLEQWVTDEELLLQFAGTDFSYPITQSQLAGYQKEYPDRRFYIGYTDNDIPFAFGEIIPQADGTPRLSRILVGEPVLRGRGLGLFFIKLLVAECESTFASNQIKLFVVDKNYAAIRCYTSAGFIYNPIKHKELFHKGKRYNIHEMTYYSKRK